MNVSLPKPPQAYDYTNEVEHRRLVELAFNEALSKAEDFRLQPGQRVILTSPGGVLWALAVDDAGALSTVAV